MNAFDKIKEKISRILLQKHSLLEFFFWCGTHALRNFCKIRKEMQLTSESLDFEEHWKFEKYTDNPKGK